MRTKVLALSALVGALGAVSAVAQTNVYSINAVGYINVTIPPGYSILACQLITPTNTIGSLMNDSTGIFDNCQTYKYNPSHANYKLDIGDSQGSTYANGWDNGGTDTMNPGEAIWINNENSTAITTTFVGTVPQGTNVVNLGNGFNLVSSPVPFSGDIVTNMGLTNYPDASQVFVYNNPSAGHPKGSYTISFVDLQGGTQGYKSQWDTPDPVANVAQGFWFKANGAFAWTQVFSINP
jgi:hypothetical protein